MILKKAFSNSVHSKNSVKSSDHSESDTTTTGDDSSGFQFEEFGFENENTDSTTSTAIPDDVKFLMGSFQNNPRNLADVHVVYSDDRKNDTASSNVMTANNNNYQIQDKVRGLETTVEDMRQKEISYFEQFEKLKGNCDMLRKENKELAEIVKNSEKLSDVVKETNGASLKNDNFRSVNSSQNAVVSRKIYDKAVGERLELSMTNQELMSRISELGKLVINANQIQNKTMKRFREEEFRAQKLENISSNIQRKFEEQKFRLHQKIDSLTGANKELICEAKQMKCDYEETICKLMKQRVDDLKQLQSKAQDDKSVIESAQRGKLDCVPILTISKEEDYELERKFETYVQAAPYGSSNEVLIDKKFYDQLKCSYLTVETQKNLYFNNEQQFQNLQAQHGELQQKFTAQEKELQRTKGTIQELYSMLSGTVSGSVSALDSRSLDEEKEDVEFSDQATPVEEVKKAFEKSKWKKFHDRGSFLPSSWNINNGKALKFFQSIAN